MPAGTFANMDKDLESKPKVSFHRRALPDRAAPGRGHRRRRRQARGHEGGSPRQCREDMSADTQDEEAEHVLRQAARFSYFKRTVMVFRRA